MVVFTKFLVFVLLLCRLLASSGAAAASAPGGTRAVSWFFPEGSELRGRVRVGSRQRHRGDQHRRRVLVPARGVVLGARPAHPLPVLPGDAGQRYVRIAERDDPGGVRGRVPYIRGLPRRTAGARRLLRGASYRQQVLLLVACSWRHSIWGFWTGSDVRCTILFFIKKFYIDNM